MLTLAIDTATKVCTIALCRDKEILAEYTINMGMTHSEGLLPQLDQLLQRTGVQKQDIELLAVRLLDFLKELKPVDFISRFRLEETDLDNIDSYELLKIIARKRGMLISGGEVNTERAAIMLLDEFRSAKLGRITVEMPNGVLK